MTQGANVSEPIREAAAKVPERLAELARIGATSEGGVTRLPFSGAEGEAVALFSHWAGNAGATVVRDEFGNVFAYHGEWNADPCLMVGSHLDTVVNGGAYDGALGVVAGLAALEAWDDDVPLCVVAFRAEETTQAGIGRVGSSVVAGTLAAAAARDLFDADAADPLPPLEVESVALPRTYLELHVEQGEILERERFAIGVVTGITGYARWRAAFEGHAAHVGAAPMDTRRDALAAAAEVILEVERLGREALNVGTVGRLDVGPNRVGVVPAHVKLTADLRAWDDQSLDSGLRVLSDFAAAACERRRVELASEVVDRIRTVRFPDPVVAAVAAAADAAGERWMRLPSAANHDAGTLSQRCRTGMVFVPSRAGHSHSPDEFTAPDECTAGSVVLSLAMLLLATQDRDGT